MGLGRYEGFRRQKFASKVARARRTRCDLWSTKKMRRCDPEAQPSAVRDHQPSDITPRTSGSSRPCPWYRANRDSLPTAPKQDFTPPLVAVKHMIIPARGAGFGPEPPQGPRGVAPCPGFSAAHCWGALKPSLSHFSPFSQIRHLYLYVGPIDCQVRAYDAKEVNCEMVSLCATN